VQRSRFCFPEKPIDSGSGTKEHPMAEQPKYDLLLRGGHVICPASGIDGIHDVAIRDGRVAAIEQTILPSSAGETIDVSGKLVLPGMIDTHAHVYQYVTGRFGLKPDMVGVRSGVTTVIDQGGPSCMTLPGFRHFIAERLLRPAFCLRAGKRFDADAPILPQAVAA
jgi:predicted amidohydrolase